MNKKYEEAKKRINDVVYVLSNMVVDDEGEPGLSNYAAHDLDELIAELITASNLMAVGQYIDEKTEEWMSKKNDQ